MIRISLTLVGAFIGVLVGIAEAAPRACDNRALDVAPNSAFAKTVRLAFYTHANVRGRVLQAKSDPIGMTLVRNCIRNEGSTQEASVRYRGAAILQGTRTSKIYACGSTFMRIQYYRGNWSDWRHEKTGCGNVVRSPRSSVLDDRLPTGEYIPGGNSSSSPDEVYDPDYRDRYGSSGGPDDVDDGDGSFSGDSDSEYGDLYH